MVTALSCKQKLLPTTTGVGFPEATPGGQHGHGCTSMMDYLSWPQVWVSYFKAVMKYHPHLLPQMLTRGPHTPIDTGLL